MSTSADELSENERDCQSIDKSQHYRLMTAIEDENLDIIQQCRGTISLDDVLNNDNPDEDFLVTLAKCTNVEIFKEMNINYGLTIEHLRSHSGGYDGEDFLQIIPITGDVDVLVELWQSYGLTLSDIIPMLDTCISQNNLDFVKQLILFGIKREDYDTDTIRIMLIHIKDTTLLLELKKWGITVNDFGVDSGKMTIVDNAIRSGNLELFILLRTEFGLTMDDDRRSLYNACEYNSVNILKELREGYGLTIDHARKYHNESLIICIKKGYIDTFRELHDGYGLTAKDAMSALRQLVGKNIKIPENILSALMKIFEISSPAT
jgi:hypothetical protein